ncbi:MAG: glycosyltransferase [Candidatus Pacearchaeota archaeon]|nr:glycosyltransferase [Candidatus Pacearchaeota archaeon]
MKFSLVIPVAPDRNAPIIESIKKLDYPKDEFHIVVVKGLNPSENRNKGASKSKGDIICFLDDDATLPSNYLKKAKDFFDKYNEIDVVGGPQLSPLNEKGFAKISGYALSSILGSASSSSRYKRNKLNLNTDEKSLTSANLFVKKEVMDKIKFDPSLWPGEDPKFIEDAKKEKFKVAYSPDLIMYHMRRPTPRQMMKQIFNYGRVRPVKESFFETLKKPQFIVPSFAIIYALSYFIAIILNPQLISGLIFNNLFSINFLLVLPFVLYAFLVILFSFYESIKHKDLKAIFILPFVYFMIHMSYGFGIIVSWFVKPKDRRLVR